LKSVRRFDDDVEARMIRMDRDEFRSARTLVVGDLRIDVGARTVTRAGQIIELPRLSFDLLLALAQAVPDTLSLDQLLEQVWNGAVVSPGTVAKRVELLRRALGDDSDDPRYVALVRGYGYRLVPSPTLRSPSPAQEARRRVPTTAWLAAGVVAVLAVGAWWLRSPDAPAPPPPQRSIAVLPFSVVGDDPRDQRLADGLAEQLSHALARGGALKVTGRSSSFRFRDPQRDVSAIGETLGVAHLLEGSVRRQGDRLRVAVNLVDTADGFQRWGETYDRPVDDVLEIQRAIAEQVAEQLRFVLVDRSGPSRKPVTTNPEAYALYLEALPLSEYPRGTDLPLARRLLEQAVELDSSFALAWAKLAAVHGQLLFWRDPSYGVSLQESLAIIRDAVDRALAADPTNGDAYASLAGLAWVFEGDSAKAARLLEHAVRFSPNNLDILFFAADFALSLGQTNETRRLMEYVLARDPLCDRCRYMLARSQVFGGELDAARDTFRTLVATNPDRSDWAYELFAIEARLGDTADPGADDRDGINSILPMGLAKLSNHPRDIAARALAAHKAGNPEVTDALWAELSAWEHPYAWLIRSQVAAQIGRSGEAMDALEQALPENRVELQRAHAHPAYAPLHGTERWQSFLRSIGRAPEQVQAIRLDFARWLNVPAN
jgi:TolB-like protein/DNA-binding winged helix-turn-helix (wHTH) protein